MPRNAARVVQRKGVDPYPIDITNEDEELRLLSFTWPDQHERLQRLRTAIDIAKRHKPFIDRDSADTWIHRQLSRQRDRATVVFHSITWQYLGREVQKKFVSALEEAAMNATAEKPLIWARMEPAGPVADVQVTLWTGCGVTLALAVVSTWAERRRARRTNLDDVGFMPWPLILILALLMSAIFAALALHAG